MDRIKAQRLTAGDCYKRSSRVGRDVFRVVQVGENIVEGSLACMHTDNPNKTDFLLPEEWVLRLSYPEVENHRNIHKGFILE